MQFFSIGHVGSKWMTWSGDAEEKLVRYLPMNGTHEFQHTFMTVDVNA